MVEKEFTTYTFDLNENKAVKVNVTTMGSGTFNLEPRPTENKSSAARTRGY